MQVSTNFEIPVSKFPVVVSGSKYIKLFNFFMHEIQKNVKISYFYDRKYCTFYVFSLPLKYTGTEGKC
jgi:hypothetical protein